MTEALGDRCQIVGDDLFCTNVELLGRGIEEGAANAIPVSYTHLRAHETVLDLVCRLLLEKKKKNIT